MLLWLPWRAATTPDRTALVAPDGESFSYAELNLRADGMARALSSSGVAKGDRVALLLPNSATFAALIHASMRLGAILVPLNLRLTPAELAWQVEDADARLLLCDATTLPTALMVGERASGVRVMRVDAQDARESEPEGMSGSARPHDIPSLLDVTRERTTILREMADPDEPLAIVYTSGTSGRPKGAILGYSNFWWSAMGSALNLGIHAGDRWLAPLPLFHVGGLSVITRSAIYGTTAVLHDGFDVDRVNDALEDDGITIVSLVPTMLGRILDARDDRPAPPRLRCVLLGGGPAPRSLLERCATVGIPVSLTYGLTEACSQVATLAPSDALQKLGSSGKPLYPTRLRIARDDGSDAAAGEGGEILVSGPTVTRGYWNRPDATATAFRDGWLRTGDVGMLDADGYLFVLDRRDDLIVTGGENVYPAEVESVLLAHDEVAEVAVIGVPDAEWGQRVVALARVTEGSDITLESLRDLCAGRIARYKLPVELRITHHPLPRTATGKLSRRLARELWEDGTDND